MSKRNKNKNREIFDEDLPPIKFRKFILINNDLEPNNGNDDDNYNDNFGEIDNPDPEPEKVYLGHINIEKDIKSIDDLIEIGKSYDDNYTYNIDVKTLFKLVEPLTELKKMIGMNSIKENMIDHILFKIQNFDESHNMMMHTIIQGPPGCGKTEVSRIIGKIYLAMGILKNDKFIKATRSDLIAGYLGQTAKATQKIIDSAKGGVLFIDEVYSLGNEEKRDSFSKECIDTINENLTERKTDFICIIAGYKEEIKNCFFNYNPGLERRFPIRFSINEYSAPELFLIFKKKVFENNWNIHESVKVNFFEKNYKEFKFFAGDMELLFNTCKRAHSRRVFTKNNEIKKLITVNDIEKGFEAFKNKEKDVKDKDENEVWKMMYM